MKALDIAKRKHGRVHVNNVSIVSKENEAFSRKENEEWWRMFKNTKKVNMVQEQQKIKSFSLWELTKQNMNFL